MFGIDQQVQQTADAYRGKPQMLQQKYAQNQQLIDLLALQKLKSDKAEAARQMALSAGGKPPTIADQRESEALDNAKKEVIQEQPGLAQNAMQQQQDAQKKLLQSAGAPQMPGQPTSQAQQSPAPGLAGLAADNIAPKMMAGGGIVAFRTGDAVEGDAGEAEARRYIEEQRQRQAAPPPQTQQAAPQGGMQAGLARLLGIDPEAIYQRRNEAAARAANFSPEEAAGKRQDNQEKANAYERNKLGRALMAMAGNTSNYGAIAAGGAQAANDADQAMRERHRGNDEFINAGVASRMAGTKAGEAGYQHGMTGLTSGVDAAARMAATGEQGANRVQIAKDAAELRAAVAREAESGRSESRATARQKVILDFLKDNNALMIANGKAASGNPADKAAANALFTQLYRQTEAMIGDAGNAGTAPPVVTQSQSSGQRPPPPPGFNPVP